MLTKNRHERLGSLFSVFCIRMTVGMNYIWLLINIYNEHLRKQIQVVTVHTSCKSPFYPDKAKNKSNL